MEQYKKILLNAVSEINIETPYLTPEVRYVLGGFGAVIGGLFGGYDGYLYALVVFMCIDYFSGIMIAINNKELSSAIGFKGLTKKVQILMLVVVGHVLDSQVVGSGSVFRTAIIMAYLANEGISITENSAKLGLPVPKKIVEWLIQVKEAEMFKSADEESEVENNADNSEENAESN